MPVWGLSLRAKLDTGARTSALHVRDLEIEGGAIEPGRRVRFDVVLGTRSAPEHHPIETVIVGRRRVRDTGARAEQRAVVRTRLLVGGIDTDADITLTDRSGMNFRMLLGRTTLSGHCVVDPNHGYMAGRTAPLPVP